MGKRGPLKREIGRVLRGRSDPEQVAIEVLGAELGARVCRWFRRARIRGAARDGITWLDSPRDNRDPVVRRGLALVLMVSERISVEHRRASGVALWRGRRYRETDSGDRVHVPSVKAGGLAARLGCSPREIERYLAVISACGLWQIHQRPPTAAEVDRGMSWGFAVYQWAGALPGQLVTRLRTFYGQRRVLPAAPAVSRGVPITDAGRAIMALVLRTAVGPPLTV